MDLGLQSEADFLILEGWRKEGKGYSSNVNCGAFVNNSVVHVGILDKFGHLFKPYWYAVFVTIQHMFFNKWSTPS